LQRIDRDLIEHVMQAKQHRKTGMVNRYLATIRNILRKAEREWGWIERSPVMHARGTEVAGTLDHIRGGHQPARSVARAPRPGGGVQPGNRSTSGQCTGTAVGAD